MKMARYNETHSECIYVYVYKEKKRGAELNVDGRKHLKLCDGECYNISEEVVAIIHFHESLRWP
jgi:hypothetical protein